MLVAALEPQSTATVWLSQRLRVEVGSTYGLIVRGRFTNVSHDQGYCNVSLDGVGVLSRQSTGDKREGVWSKSVEFAAQWERPLLEVNIASTWGRPIAFEFGDVEVELVG